MRTMMTKRRVHAPAFAVLVVLALGGCDILDVSNPNNLVDDDIRQREAASAVANGALSLTADAVADIWQPYLVASDEMFWIGSRDAWLQLDQGFVSNPENEFTDAAFPSVGQARWMADEAIEILEGHVAEDPDDTGLLTDLGRANFYAGIIYTVIGEVMEDFAFSDQREAAPPVGPDNMNQVLDQGIAYLDEAIRLFQQVGDADRELAATAARARAHHSRAIWDLINPTATGTGYASSSAAATDAQAVIGMAGGVTADWSWGFTYSASTLNNDMADWVNDRKENTHDPTLVTLNDDMDVTGVALLDPIDRIADPVVSWKMAQWKGAELNADDPPKGGEFPPLDFTSTRLMHLILAEEALASGDMAGFTLHINHVRDMDGLTPYAAQIPARDMLIHERRVNLMIMGLRLADMYRFGITASLWESASDIMQNPGVMLPITITEIRANCHMNGQGC